ncbi:MAG: hypothetical protein ABI051_15765 [Vicinamibacterales bacterium]
MSPIFVRPVREQLEHDRLIRHLQTKYKRKFEVAANPGEEQVAPVKIGTNTFFPDLVLTTGGRKLAGLVEVESAESVNNLEAMAQWVHFARARVPFHLYVPVQGYEAARRLCDANHVRAGEIWTYRPAADGFDLVKVFADPAAAGARRPPMPGPPKPVDSPGIGAAKTPARRPERVPRPAPAPAAKSAKKSVMAEPRRPAKPVRKPAPPARKRPAPAKSAKSAKAAASRKSKR